MAKIIGPGSCMVDITGYASHLPSDGETAVGDLVRTSPGGKGSNQMIAAHRAGSEVFLIACVGDDSAASVLNELYRENKMSTKYIRVCQGENTGTALIQINKTDAQNRILIIRGANLSLSDEDVKKAECDFRDCDIVLTQLETDDAPICEAARLAKKYGKPFCLNPAPYRPLSDELLSMTDYITPNETEAEFLTGIHIESAEDAGKAAEVLLSKGVKNVVITLGVNGAYYTDGKREIKIDGIKVTAVETTGAGDAFLAGALATLDGGGNAGQALEKGIALGAEACKKRGAL